ncbi:MAG: HEAT repeat domain-containing protein, partial [Planctomycetes bacterium]|nr:HEAT repeat domain-containing protein [Planctomycetota bacterium]
MVDLARQSKVERYFRVRLIDALVDIGDPAAIPWLCAALNDGDRSVRASAFVAIGQIGDPRAVDPLIAWLNDPDDERRLLANYVASQALGGIGDSRAVPSLIPLLQDANATIRRHAVNALGDIADSAAAESLIAIRKDPDLDVRRCIIESLYALADERAMQELFQIAIDDADPKLRLQAAGFISRTWKRETMPELLAFCQRVSDPGKTEIVRGLAQANDLDMLHALLRNDDVTIVSSVADGLAELRDKRELISI